MKKYRYPPIIFDEKIFTKKEFQTSINTTLKLTWHVYVC